MESKMNTQEEILNQIKKYSKIIIHRHQRPDPDAFGAQIGLAEIIKASFPYKEVFTVGKDFPSLDWIGKMDDLSTDEFNDALVIVVDTANAPRIDDRRFDKGDKLIKIDHHPNDEPFGDIMWVDPSASSCSELIYDFYSRYSDQLKMTKKAANALYAGIVGDTGRFLYPATTAKTMLVAGALIANGAQAAAISQRENQITLPLAKLSAYVYENLTVSESGAAYVVLSDEVLKRYGLSESGTSAVVPLPGKIVDVKAWAIFVQQEDGHFRVRLRSKGPAINGLAKKHRGGGHELASGAKARDTQEIQQIVEQLEELTSTE